MKLPMEKPETPIGEISPKILFAEMPAGAYQRGEKLLMLREDVVAELSQLLGRNIADVDDLLLAARNVSTLSVDGIEGGDITLDSYLLNRLKSRCPTNVDFGGFVRDRVKELLAGFAGC